MYKSISFVMSLLVSFVALASEIPPQPSSEIPAKREFPLNTDVNPCEDFHKYVCSKAEAAFKLRDDRSRHTFSFNDSAERILTAKMNFLAHIGQQKKLNARTEQIRDTYLACMNEKTGVESEKKEVKRILDEVSALKNVSDFEKFQISQLEKGQDSLLSFDAYSNQDNPKINDMFVFVELMNLPENSYYDNAELMTDYRKLVINFFKVIEPGLSDEKAATRADRMIKLEKEFVKIYPVPAVRRQRWSQKRQEKQADFLAKYPNLQLADFFKKTPKTSLISNSLPEALEFYNKALTADNFEALKDFYLYAAVSPILDDSNPDFFNQKFSFNNKFLGGPVKRSERGERCTKKVMWTFTKELDQALVKKMFPHFPTAKFKQVVDRIRQSIIAGMKKNTWLEPATRDKAILKIEKAKLYLVKPETAKQWDFVPVRKYSQTNRLENQYTFQKAILDKKIKSLKDGANLEAWDMGPLTVNAYYDPSANKFVMPMGILQYPFFNPDGDLIENLGAVGAVAGHELGHGIDDQGARYDENGQLKQWMTMKDLKEFSERGHRLVEFFNKAGHNGELTLGENIGDLVGLTFAYQAAFPDGKAKPEDERRLYIAYGRLWCGVARPKAEEEQLKTDPHALGWARINEQVKHQKAFSEAFGCKAGDKMYLPDDQRVKIW